MSMMLEKKTTVMLSNHGSENQSQSIKQINKLFRQLAANGEFSALIAHMKENPDAIDINGTSSNGNTALHWASQRNHSAVVKELLSRPEINITAVNRAADTPRPIGRGFLDRSKNLP
ncbi:ankyrin repeat domain-containing protein, partial [Endozoicomonas sp. YOMI1]|uniref:ankyrin repeat domain-containing protein n=1 Tax=Endozoicomonas sp. YOMI1 TaxID=2828739 RepID=UPI0021489B45